MLSVEEQIEHLKEKGISFKLTNEEDAKHFLIEHNYYFKLTSYRHNFPKYHSGKQKGKYVGLDFFHLQDLSIVDMYLRNMILSTCLSIEHSLKVNLLRNMELNKLNSIQISREYTDIYPKCLDEIKVTKDVGT